jgi:hypothetical protein
MPNPLKGASNISPGKGKTGLSGERLLDVQGDEANERLGGEFLIFP